MEGITYMQEMAHQAHHLESALNEAMAKITELAERSELEYSRP